MAAGQHGMGTRNERGSTLINFCLALIPSAQALEQEASDQEKLIFVVRILSAFRVVGGSITVS